MRRSRGLGAVLAFALVYAVAAMPITAQARPLTLGIMDAAPFEGADNALWYGRARGVGADIVRLTAHWSQIAPKTRAALRDPRDPGDAGYDWRWLDAAVRGAGASGLSVMLTLQAAPAWAEGANRPASARPGSWRPDPGAFGDFVQAAVVRYGGSYPDPLIAGAALPRVRFWQPWNEPNLPRYLTPQWSGRGGRTRAVSPAWYRRLLNAAYARVKAADRDNRVIAAGTAPYGDPPSFRNRMTPVRFLSELLCLERRGLRRLRCPDPARLDAIDHHPYATGSPTQHALLPENVAVPDLRKLTRVVRAARRHKTIRPVRGKEVWITELSWDSRPPDPDGVPEARLTRWVQDSLYSLWRQGASRIFWFLLRDQAPTPSYDRTYQSGLFTVDGRVKAAAAGFRLPLVVRRGAAGVAAWVRSAEASAVTIERRNGARWSRIGSLRRTSASIFQGRIDAPRGAVLRARAGAHVSPARSVR